jgi:hypothetical protein
MMRNVPKLQVAIQSEVVVGEVGTVTFAIHVAVPFAIHVAIQ